MALILPTIAHRLRSEKTHRCVEGRGFDSRHLHHTTLAGRPCLGSGNRSVSSREPCRVGLVSLHRPSPDPVGPGQESVWSYPRPPALERVERHVCVRLGGLVIAETKHALRVLETSHPPTYYVPHNGVEWSFFEPAVGTSFCEWKGDATYRTVTAGTASVVGRAWSYQNPSRSFAAIAGAVAFYPAHFECYVDDERVRPQPGEFYGGWITDEIKGPFKGIPGSMWW